MVPAGAVPSPRWAQGQIIVQRRAGIPEQEFRDMLEFYAAADRSRIEPIEVHVLSIQPGQEQAIVQELEDDPAIAFAERDRLVELAYVPSDTHYPTAWHLQTLHLPSAWDTTLGTGVTVAVLDTGVNANHEDMAGKLAPGWNAVEGSASDYSDVHGHGTAVAGIIGAVTDNGIGVASVAPAALIMPVRVSVGADGGAFTSDIAAGLIWAADQGAKVGNISYNVSSSLAVANAAQYMRNKGGVVVVAAGNQSGDPGYTDSPYMISVSATTRSDSLADWSNFGNYIDVAAPGQGIWTTHRNGGYSAPSGTSFATPTAAAVVALIMSIDSSLSPDAVEGILETSADDLGPPGFDTRYGHGRINAASAVALAAQGQVVDRIPPVVTAPADLTVEATGALTAVALGTATAADAVDGRLSAVPSETGPFAPGAYTIIWSATDSAGNTGTAAQTLVLRDTTPPAVTAPQDISVQSVGSAVSVSLGTATASDLVDGDLAATPNTTGPFAVGTHTVVWTVTDAAGNAGSDTQRVTVSLNDITPPQVTAPPDIVVEATGALTAVSLGSPLAWDDADGTLVAAPDRTGPFKVGAHSISWRAADSAGNVAISTQRVTVVDTTPPRITVPPDLTVAATGYVTAVALGTASAIDTVSDTVSISVDKPGPFTSGRHVLTWTAVDLAGNTATAVQELSVIPLVTAEADQLVSEGAKVSFSVQLSGEAPVYPVEVPYRVSGSALNPEDHNVVEGVIRIVAGIRGRNRFRVVDDGITGEPEEQILFTLGSPVNALAGSRTAHRVRIIEGNASPRVALQARQSGVPARIVYSDGGPVTVTAVVEDPNPRDAHSFDWGSSDNTLVSVSGSGAPAYRFDPASLAPGLYTVRLRVTDDGIPSEFTEVPMTLRVETSAPTLSVQADTDGDGVTDAVEGLGDDDTDGIPDYLDAIADPTVLQGQDSLANRDLLVTEAGLRLRLGATALAAGRAGARLALSDVMNFAPGASGLPADDALIYPGGLFDFEVSGLAEPGQSVSVVLPQAAGIPAQAVYRKYFAGQGWQDFVVDARNTLASASGVEGTCPAPGSHDYVSGLQPGHGCVQLTLEDGGPNDADGLRNGVVLDPGGVGTPPLSTGAGSATSSPAGGGGGCSLRRGGGFDSGWLLIALGLWFLGSGSRTGPNGVDAWREAAKKPALARPQ